MTALLMCIAFLIIGAMLMEIKYLPTYDDFNNLTTQVIAQLKEDIDEQKENIRLEIKRQFHESSNGKALLAFSVQVEFDFEEVTVQ